MGLNFPFTAYLGSGVGLPRTFCGTALTPPRETPGSPLWMWFQVTKKPEEVGKGQANRSEKPGRLHPSTVSLTLTPLYHLSIYHLSIYLKSSLDLSVH